MDGTMEERSVVSALSNSTETLQTNNNNNKPGYRGEMHRFHMVVHTRLSWNNFMIIILTITALLIK